jgi:hypothetical protein
MIEGHPPFANMSERYSGSVPARMTAASNGVDAVILRCLEKAPSKRYQNMRALEDALRHCLSEPTPLAEDSPTVVQHTTDLNRSELVHNISRVRGMQTLASASVASGFFGSAPLSSSRLFAEGSEFFLQVRQTFEFYRKHLDDEYRQLSAQIESAHKLWIACVGVGFAVLLGGLLAVLFGNVTQGVVTSAASTMIYFIVRIFQRREDYYREEKAIKMRYLQYGNDWLLLIQSIEAIPDPADRLEEQRRLARVLLDRIKHEEPLRPSSHHDHPTTASDADGDGPKDKPKDKKRRSALRAKTALSE